MKALNFNRGSKSISAFLIVFITLATSVSALVKVDFSGTWALDQAKSNLGERGGRGAAAKLSVVQENAVINIVRTSNGQNGEVITTEKLTYDGKEAQATGGREGSVRKSTLTWSEDKNTMTVNSVVTGNFNGTATETKIKEVWTLSADGKTLTVDSESVRQQGTTTLKLVYNKQ